MNYLHGGDSFQLVKQGEHAIQTLRTPQPFSLLWADLNLKLKTLDAVPRVFLYHADGHHHPMGDHLSSSKGWGIVPPFAPTDWHWIESWGKTLTENHPWTFLNPPPDIDYFIKNGIITLTNYGHDDIGILFAPLVDLPLQNEDGKHLHLSLDCPFVTTDSYSTQVGLGGYFYHPIQQRMHYALWIALGDYYWISGQYGVDIPPPFYRGEIYIGPGKHHIDFLQLWQRWRTSLELSTDPTNWTTSNFHFGFRTSTPGTVDQLTNDYIGWYYPTIPGDPPPPPGSGYIGPNRLYRVRFPMTPYAMTPSEYYALLLRCGAYYSSQAPEWQYDKGDSTYPYGIRIFSPDGGYTWNEYFNDDHIFALFGTPPAPPPPPPPPIDHWTILDIQQIRTSTGYIIIATTNVPCHLYMFWTNIEPEKHPRTRISRGLTVPDATDYCFVVWHENEQEEPGDTIYHTFIKEPWPVCETRWFTFRALVNNEWSPSVGPIFKKHRAVRPPFIEPYTIVELLPSLVFTDQYTIEPNPPDYTEVFTDPYTWS